MEPRRSEPAAGAAVSADDRRRRLARYYDLDLADITYDAELYQQLAHETGGPVYEMAVGSGRLAIPLAMAGHEVVGVDHDAAMLDRARRAWQRTRGAIPAERLRLHEGDLRTFRPDGSFGLTYIAVNTFLLAPDDEARLAILSSMRSVLHRGGMGVIEIGTPDQGELARYDGHLQHEWLRRDRETGDEVRKSIAATYDEESSILQLTQLYERTSASGGASDQVTNVDILHLVPAQRLAELAEMAGFTSVDLRGDHLLMPYGAGSHRVILIARLL